MAVVVSLAQVPVVKGDIRTNLSNHLIQIEQSAHHGADVVVFPELSLTGYELELAKELALDKNPARFSQLSQASIEHEVVVIAGCPLNVDYDSKPAIGAVICFPDGRVEFYSKQFLHPGEERYCVEGSGDYFVDLNGYKIALAVCADFSNPEHSKRARQLGADLYIASALISESGFQADALQLQALARTNQFSVLLSNHISQTGGWNVAGNNTIWGADGDVEYGSGTKQPCIFVCTIENDTISTATYLSNLT
ncbi:carbon-nitrogen hydrolase family protein [uncultured Vibrio sp.]|uniref:carbon-nitrogen hydrolase family protein n=1 Tax=uncultured Vibrio sp. TaxID=114054 RepID=UPI00091442EB|nr:carbon-nitrogen hydrolase family protein [uncultured Vibrio sp.]OIQ26517.1 MAG: carbon-nitrogen hydrolase family protein [Vibrio sp. MedPE-SWchi]